MPTNDGRHSTDTAKRPNDDGRKSIGIVHLSESGDLKTLKLRNSIDKDIYNY